MRVSEWPKVSETTLMSTPEARTLTESIAQRSRLSRTTTASTAAATLVGSLEKRTRETRAPGPVYWSSTSEATPPSPDLFDAVALPIVIGGLDPNAAGAWPTRDRSGAHAVVTVVWKRRGVSGG